MRPGVIRWSLVIGGSSCGGGGRAGGCRGRRRCRWRVSSRTGAGSRGCRAGRRRGRRGRTSSRRWRVAAGGGGGGAFGAGAGGGALVPPGVVQVGDRVAQLRADGAGVAADELADGGLADAEGAGDAGRAVAHDVQGAQPQPGAAGVDAAARDGGLVTARMAVVVPRVGRRRPGPGPETVAGARPAAVAMALVGAAVLAQAADVGAGGAGAGRPVRRASRGAGRERRGVDAHLS